MNHSSSENLFRLAAEEENGASISAGARMIHVRQAVASGRAFLVYLSGVSEECRPLVVAEIMELVKKASSKASNATTDQPPRVSDSAKG